ncbi:bacterial type II and III secretion system family protein, partial [Escherichia coli 90.0039]
PIKSASSE